MRISSDLRDLKILRQPSNQSINSTGVRVAVWLIMVIALAGFPHAGLAQDRALIPDSSIAIPPLQFDSSGALVIRASPASSQHDFDYLVGT